MADWKLNYGINLNSKGDDKLKCNLSEKGGNGIQLVMGGSIPEAEGTSPEAAIELLKSKIAGLDELDAKDPASHVQYLNAIAEFCTDLASSLSGQ